MTAVEWLESEIFRRYKFTFQNINCQQLEEAIAQAKEMENIQSFPNVNRVEVIQHSEPHNGRAYTNYNAKDVEIQLQDDGKTLKIFLK